MVPGKQQRMESVQLVPTSVRLRCTHGYKMRRAASPDQPTAYRLGETQTNCQMGNHDQR